MVLCFFRTILIVTILVNNNIFLLFGFIGLNEKANYN